MRAATSSARGEVTRFQVRKLPDTGTMKVRRDGSDHGGWRATGPDAIEIDTAVGSHTYEVFTGYRGGGAARGDRPPGSSADISPAGARTARTRVVDIATAIASVGTLSASCPCCAGTLT